MAMTLITTNTHSGDTDSAFTSSIDSTYKLYIFKFININPSDDGSGLGILRFQANASGQSGYNETITSTAFRAIHTEDNTTTADFAYVTGQDLANATTYQDFNSQGTGAGGDESTSGTLWLFNPSNTTYVKHFYSEFSSYGGADLIEHSFVSGYFNVTAAIVNLNFTMLNGSAFDGVIKMYGVG